VIGKRDKKRRIKFQKGFTLVELMIVVVLIGIIAAIATPAFQRYAINANLKSAARDITSDFLRLKERAIAENVEYRIIFNVAGNSYTIQQGTAAGAPYVDLMTKSPASFGSDINFTANTTFGAGAIFRSRGTVTNGTIELINSRGSTATITVNITGRTYADIITQ
jgi:prepilin-type N-terminal cleavage/methylation domain-containing protein